MTFFMRHTSFRIPVAHILRRQLSTANAAQWKNPPRGGQNLSERYKRLESMLRGKKSMTQHIDTISKGPMKVKDTSSQESAPSPNKRPIATFHGFVIPEEPTPPSPEECCMSGCAVCVQDLYAEAQDKYKASVKSLHTSLTKLGISEQDWPSSIKTNKPESVRNIDAGLAALAKMEARLKAKRAANAGN